MEQSVWVEVCGTTRLGGSLEQPVWVEVCGTTRLGGVGLFQHTTLFYPDDVSEEEEWCVLQMLMFLEDRKIKRL